MFQPLSLTPSFSTLCLSISLQARKNSLTKILKTIHHLGNKMSDNRGSGLDNDWYLLQEDLKSQEVLQVSKPRDISSPEIKTGWAML